MANSKEKSAEDMRSEAELDKRLNVMCVSAGIMALSISICVPARAPLILAMKKGDASATAKTMGLMSSTAALLEIFMNPVLGRLSDKYGRRPFLMLGPAVTAILHTLVALFPTNLTLNFADRCISGAFIFAFVAPMQAALQDLLAGRDMTKLAITGARLGSNFGLGFAAGPFIGSKLSGGKAFAASAAIFLTNFAYIAANFKETLPEDKRKEFDITAINPFSFVHLFKTRAMATLSAVIGFSSFAEYANIYDINFLFMKTVMGYGQEQVGRFAGAFGITQILGGRISKKLMETIGLPSYSSLAYAAYFVGFVVMGSAKNAAMLGAALTCMTFGHQRASEAGILLAAHGTAAGMGRGEIQGAQGNLLAVLKIMAPILYGRLFAWSTSEGRSSPGSPYYLICAFLAAAQATFLTYDRSSLPQK